MFDVKQFVTNALTSGYETGQFSRERVAIMATDYMVKGVLDVQDLAAIAQATAEPEIIPDEQPQEVPMEEYETTETEE